MKSDKLFILYINQNKLLKKYTITQLSQCKHKMDTIFMNSENSETSHPHRLLLNLADKINLQRCEKKVALSSLSIYYTWNNIKSSYNNKEFKISAPTWNDKYELPDGSYSVSDIQDYFKYILKKHKENKEYITITKNICK